MKRRTGADPALMQALAETLDTALNGKLRGPDRHTGFVLLVFPFHQRMAEAAYISSAQRADVINFLYDQIEKLEQAEAELCPEQEQPPRS